MYLTADPVPAAELARYGGWCGSSGHRAPRRRLRARRAHRPAQHRAVRTAKQSLNTIEYMELKPGYEFEQRLTGQLAGTDDSKEARRAIIEKRPPRFGSLHDARALTATRASRELRRCDFP